MMLPPTLKTGRLTLRAHNRDDFEPYAALMGSADAAFMGGPYCRKDAWSIFANDNVGWLLYGFGTWAIEREGAFVGQVGAQWPERFPEPEFGWMLLPVARGMGYATEAARAGLAWLFANSDRTSIVSHVDPENAGSIAVAKRLGGTPDPDAWREDAEDVIYRHRRETFQ
ncbi:MAG: GNAT family N-acetyltransferase [Pseudomonadota bacterium]